MLPKYSPEFLVLGFDYERIVGKKQTKCCNIVSKGREEIYRVSIYMRKKLLNHGTESSVMSLYGEPLFGCIYTF